MASVVSSQQRFEFISLSRTWSGLLTILLINSDMSNSFKGGLGVEENNKVCSKEIGLFSSPISLRMIERKSIPKGEGDNSALLT